MRTKNVLVIILTALIFLSAVVLGVSTVYRVNDVSVEASLVSEEAKTEAEELKARLQTAYEKKSVFSCADSQAREIVTDFAYFRYLGFEIDYPNRLVVKIAEDAELYAAEDGNGGYYILGESGTVLGIRESSVNRADGADNILIKGMGVVGTKGEMLTGDPCLPYLFEFGKIFSARIAEMRRNVVSIEISRPASTETEMRFILTMREGVKIYIHNPASMTAEKAGRAVEEYMDCMSEERLAGMIWVAENNGNVIGKYYENSYLPASN